MQGKHKTYPCPDCGKVFNAHYNLTRHMPVHTGARPFVCKVAISILRVASYCVFSAGLWKRLQASVNPVPAQDNPHQ